MNIANLKMKITLKKKSVYGQNKYYPACEVSKGLAGLLGSTTLSDAKLNYLINVFNCEISLEADKFEI